MVVYIELSDCPHLPREISNSFQWYNKESDWAQIIQRIRDDGYHPKYGMNNLVTNVILHFDSPESFGEYDPETGYGGYGDGFTLDGLFQFVEDSGGWAEFDYLA